MIHPSFLTAALRLCCSAGAVLLAAPALAFDGGGAPLLHTAVPWQPHPIEVAGPSRGADGLDVADAGPHATFGVPSWLEQKLVAADGAMMEQFGWAMVVVGDAAYVGAPFATVNGNARQGAVYVYAKLDGSWVQVQKLTAGDGTGGESFGAAISVDGTTLLVAANRATINGNTDQGAVYVFNQSGGAWSEAQKLVADDGTTSDDFGYALKIEGDSAIIGAPFVNSRQGAAYVFRRSGGTWAQTQKLLASDADTDDLYGAALTFEGSTALVGALSATVNGNTDQGAAYFLSESGGNWSETQKIVADDGAVSDRFGTAVALSGTTALVSAIGATINDNEAQGAAYVFTQSGGSWSQSHKFAAAQGEFNDNYGYSVALRGDTAVVGVPFAAVEGNSGQGLAYLYTRTDGVWSAETRFGASDGAATSFYGWSTALEEGLVFVGAIGATVDDNAFQGAVYAYAAAPADGIFCSGFESGESGACAR